MNYSISDACPVCGKTLKDAAREHGDRLISIQGSIAICVRCGCVFLPKSQIKYVLDAQEKRIIDPNTIGDKGVPSIIQP